MNFKKLLPIVFLVVLAVIALALKRCNAPVTQHKTTTTKQDKNVPVRKESNSSSPKVSFDRTTKALFFTKHAKCRMKCRKITQQEVKDILARGKVNYSKSELDDAKGPTYAVEGVTDDQQEVRIIFAPKQKHLTVVTVIDLGEEHPCNCN